MQLWLNDDPIQCTDGLSLAALLRQLNVDTYSKALAVNQQVVPRGQWPDLLLQDGDNILLFQLIAGG